MSDDIAYPRNCDRVKAHAYSRLFCGKPENHLQSVTPKCLCTRGTHVGMN